MFQNQTCQFKLFLLEYFIWQTKGLNSSMERNSRAKRSSEYLAESKKDHIKGKTENSQYRGKTELILRSQTDMLFEVLQVSLKCSK